MRGSDKVWLVVRRKNHAVILEAVERIVERPVRWLNQDHCMLFDKSAEDVIEVFYVATHEQLEMLAKLRPYRELFDKSNFIPVTFVFHNRQRTEELIFT